MSKNKKIEELMNSTKKKIKIKKKILSGYACYKYKLRLKLDHN